MASEFLLDTNVLLWSIEGAGKLSPQAVTLLEDAENALAFSAISIWEIGIKHVLRKPGFTR